MRSLGAAPYFFTFHTLFCTMGSKEARNSRPAQTRTFYHRIPLCNALSNTKNGGEICFPLEIHIKSRHFNSLLITMSLFLQWFFLCFLNDPPKRAPFVSFFLPLLKLLILQVLVVVPLAYLEHGRTWNDQIGCNDSRVFSG